MPVGFLLQVLCLQTAAMLQCRLYHVSQLHAVLSLFTFCLMAGKSVHPVAPLGKSISYQPTGCIRTLGVYTTTMWPGVCTMLCRKSSMRVSLAHACGSLDDLEHGA